MYTRFIVNKRCKNDTNYVTRYVTRYVTSNDTRKGKKMGAMKSPFNEL
jgi:hypothetical protein